MNEKAKAFLKNLNHTVSANLILLMISLLLNLVFPKVIGLREYSYWQLYLFYTGYVGIFHLGWVDGIYLKIGGKSYEELDKNEMGSQFYFFFIMELVIGIFLFFGLYLFISDFNKKIILLSTVVTMVAMNIKMFILLVLQSTNRIKDYAKLSVNDRYLYIVLSMTYLIFGGKNFIILILLDVISKIVIVLWGISFVKDFLLAKKLSLPSIYCEILDNIKIGSKLMIGNIASLLIIGIFRILVERRWDIEVFGKLSFALTVSNMFMMFISATSVVLYPVLRRANQNKLSDLYINVRGLFVPFTLGLLIFFIPVQRILEWWLPEYGLSLFFLGILFPMVVFEGRNFLLVNTYVNTIRQEKIILIANIATLIMTILSAVVSIYVFDSVNLTVISILVCIGFRCIVAELLLAKVLEIKLVKENLQEALLIFIFVSGNVLFRDVYSFILYLMSYGVYILLKYNSINYKLKKILSLVRDNKKN